MIDEQVPEILDDAAKMLREERMKRHIDEISRLTAEGNDTKYALLALVNVLTDKENCDKEIAELLIKLKVQASRENDWRATQAVVKELQSFRRERYGTRAGDKTTVEINTGEGGVVRMLLDEMEKRTAIEVKDGDKENEGKDACDL